jgi:hypothetical protein
LTIATGSIEQVLCLSTEEKSSLQIVLNKNKTIDNFQKVNNFKKYLLAINNVSNLYSYKLYGDEENYEELHNSNSLLNIITAIISSMINGQDMCNTWGHE